MTPNVGQDVDGPLQIEAGTADLSFGEGVPDSQRASLLATTDSVPWVCPPGAVFPAIDYLAGASGRSRA